jgi:transposase
MKTIIMTKGELDKLSPETQKEIFDAYNAREIEISDLKERVKALPFQFIDYRTDTDTIANEKTDDHLTFNCWRKTAGEQWGNSDDFNYTFRIGKKYIRLYMEFSTSDHNNQAGFERELGVSVNKFDEILSLVEEAYNSEDVADKNQLISIAATRVESLVR